MEGSVRGHGMGCRSVYSARRAAWKATASAWAALSMEAMYVTSFSVFYTEVTVSIGHNKCERLLFGNFVGYKGSLENSGSK